MARIKFRIWITLIHFLGLSSCAVGPHYNRPALALPKTYTATKATTGDDAQRFLLNHDIPLQWWELFHSKPLNDLVRASLQHNPTIKAADAALKRALETIYAQQGAFFPYIGLSFSPTKQQVAKLLTSVLASNQYNYSLYTGQVFVSYTPDVFGGIRRHVESLTAQAVYQKLILEATYLTIASNVVLAAIQEAAIREQISATQKMVKSQSEIVNITQIQYTRGEAAQSDVALQEAALAVFEATLPPLQKQLAVQRNLINALTGQFPDDKHTPTFTLKTLHLPKELPLSLPSTLIEHRPDIRAAEEQMHSANALIGVAVSNRLPNVNIGFTNAGTSALSISSLFQQNTTFWALTGIITHPLFDGGNLLHQQRVAEAFYQQAAAQYQSTVINAFQNVADTLNAIRLDTDTFHATRKAEQAAQTNLTITHYQYQAGDASSIQLLTAEQMYQEAKMNVIQAEANRLSDTTALFQALGGGWWQKK